MKHIFYLLAVLLWMSSCGTHQPGNDETAIIQVLQQQVESWNKGDIDSYMKGYWDNDSLVFIGRRGPKYGYKTTLEGYKKSYPDAVAMGTLSFSNLKLKKLSDEYFYVTGGWSLARLDNPGGYFTLLFRKINGRWVIVADHTS